MYCSRKETGQTGFLAGVTDWYEDLMLCGKKTFHGDETGSPRAGPKFPPWELIPQDPSLSYIPAPSLSRDGRFGPEEGQSEVPVSQRPGPASSLTCVAPLEAPDLLPFWASQTIWGRACFAESQLI